MCEFWRCQVGSGMECPSHGQKQIIQSQGVFGGGQRIRAKFCNFENHFALVSALLLQANLTQTQTDRHTQIYTYIHTHTLSLTHTHTQTVTHSHPHTHNKGMGWLQIVGSLKSWVSFAEYCLFCRAHLQKRPIILRSLLFVATP